MGLSACFQVEMRLNFICVARVVSDGVHWVEFYIFVDRVVRDCLDITSPQNNGRNMTVLPKLCSAIH